MAAMFCPRPGQQDAREAVYRPEMIVQILSREDSQVQLSGERIEIEEIESIILSLEAIERCAVLVEENQLHAIIQDAETASHQHLDQRASIKGRHLSLQHCGLNSMDTLHGRSAMAERYGFVLDLSDFLLAGSVRSLAKLVKENMALSKGCLAEAAPSIVLEDYLPATDPQLAMCMVQQSYPDSTYNGGRLLRFRDVECDHLFASLRAVA
ncbi:MAG: hypothetical protein Q9171_001780 [Xanthocarpia ochracea]